MLRAGRGRCCCRRGRAGNDVKSRPALRGGAHGRFGAAALGECVTGQLSVFAVSDLHTDHKANLDWVRHLGSFRQSAMTSLLVVAGDVSDDLGLLRVTLEALLAKFDVVAFVPGNHCQWVRGGAGSSSSSSERNGGATDSLGKLHKVLELCTELGVVTQPAQLGNLLLVPLLSWHHQRWDKEPDIPGIPRAGSLTIADYAACKWPPGWLPDASNQLGADCVAEWFDAANESDLQQPGWALLQQALQGRSGSPAANDSKGSRPDSSSSSSRLEILSFSHFLPHQDLLPEKRFLSYPPLAKAVGSDYLMQRLRWLQPDMHIFGHSHFAWDAYVEGIRCLQAPLCYPAERQHRLKSIEFNPTPGCQWQHGQQTQQSTTHAGSSSSSQPHPLHVGLQNPALVSWLPAKVYEATFTAELQQQPAVAAGHERLLLHHSGLPVLHSRQLLQPQEQQPPPPCADAGNAHRGAHYLISSWRGSWCPCLNGLWSSYYTANARQPDNTELAPWVLKRYSRFKRVSRRLKPGGSDGGA